MDTPRADLIRAQVREAPALGDGNTLFGYVAVFDEWTEINSWEGRFLERIVPGAFKRSLDHRGAPKVLFNHGMDPAIGDKPLGRGEFHEDAHGLHMTVPLSDTSYNRDLRALLADGAIDGASFRFSVPKDGDRWDDHPPRSEHNPDGLPERSLHEVAVPEAGPVTFPAYQATAVGIRSAPGFQMFLATPPAFRAALLDPEGNPISASPAPEGTQAASSTPDSPAGRPPSGMTPGERAALLRRINLP